VNDTVMSAGQVGRSVPRLEARTKVTGRTERNEIVHFACAGDALGQMLPVRIREAYNNSLRADVEPGFVLAPSAARPSPAPAAAARRTLPVVAGP